MKVVQHCFPVVLFTRWLHCLNILTKSLNVTIQMKCFGSMMGLYCLFCNVSQNIILCSFDLASSWGHDGVVDSALDLDLKVGCSTPSPCHRVVSLDKKLYPTLSISTQVYKWVPATYCWG